MNTLTGWPFWAPSDLEAVEHALDLAQLQPGDHLVDLGCGDGQVLVAAARRGCTVAGVECDAELVHCARQALVNNDLRGDVVLGDVFEFPLGLADVIFTYLAPATLQRLVPRFQETVARLVTVDFAVPGIVAEVIDGQNHLYHLPAPTTGRETPGWRVPGVLVSVTPDRHSLNCLTLHAPGGPVRISTHGNLDGRVAIATGADDAPEGAEVAVDLRWEELRPHQFIAGTIHCEGAGDLHVFALVTDEDEGLWELTADAVGQVVDRATRGWQPTTFADLLAACDGD